MRNVEDASQRPCMSSGGYRRNYLLNYNELDAKQKP
jgi:hypothetical protein